MAILRGRLNVSPFMQWTSCSSYKESGSSLWADTAGVPRHGAKLKKKKKNIDTVYFNMCRICKKVYIVYKQIYTYLFINP